jgi:phosphoribosylformylglycinamidine synthase
MFLMVQQLIKDRKLLALHDISDGGLITTLAEMCFTKKIGMDIDVSIFDNTNESLFSEEIGFVLQASNANCDEIISSFLENNLFASKIASLADESLTILKDGEILFNESINSLEKYWRETSHAIQSIRDNKAIADSELNLLDKKEFTGLSSNISFDESQIQQINTLTSNPKVAILREQGVNGQNEMAAAFTLAGFEAVDVHMQDLLDQNIFLKDFQGMAVCGGFSYGDVLGAGGGWSKTVMYNTNVKDQFEQFFQDQAKFTLGVCNGCQMLSNLKQIIPDAEHWPSFKRNLSDQFEARLAQVKIEKTNSVLLENMEGWMVPVASAHGEGRASFEDNDLIELQANNQVAMRFADSDGESSEIYPINPNGSPQGITGITAANGRITIMMPHPERVFRKHQMSWHNKDWQEFSPWMQIFVNARKFSEGS